MGEIIPRIHRLLKATTAPSWPSTMNLLLVIMGARAAYYNDDDIPFSSFSCRYQKAFLDLATLSSIGIQFQSSGRWLIFNQSAHLPKTMTHAEFGKLLQFPCSPAAMDIAKGTAQKVGVELRIHTEHHDTLITQFFCFKREIPRIIRWFKGMRDGFSSLYRLDVFKTFEPYVIIEEYTIKGSTLTPKPLRRITLGPL